MYDFPALPDEVYFLVVAVVGVVNFSRQPVLILILILILILLVQQRD